MQKNKELEEQLHREQIADAIRKEEELRLAAQITEQQLDAEKKNVLIAELNRQEEKATAQRIQQEQEVELLRQKQQNTELKLLERANFQRNAYIIGALGIATLTLFGVSWFFARRASRRLKIQNTKIEAQKNQIEVERSKSERLLRNILPDEIADELKTRGHASPRLYDSATVVFTDFVNFTRLSTHMLPEKIISELDECFAAFDEICEKYGLEKIKTIGDAFMCAGGLPVPNNTHPLDAVKAAKEMIEWLNNRNTQKESAVFREMRIGIHTGPVVAGVIGKNKFAYDIWGDAVNLASRLEEKGEPMRINISGSTYEAIKHEFNCIHRGQQEVHNKGLVDMYFVS